LVICRKFSLYLQLSIFVSGLLCGLVVTAAEHELSVEETYAHYIIEVSKQLHWPNEEEFAQFSVAVLGANSKEKAAYTAKEDELVRNKKIKFEFFEQYLPEASSHQIIILSANKRSISEGLFKTNPKSLIITIGRTSEDFHLVSFVDSNDLTKIRINQNNLNARGFKISTLLLDLTGTKKDIVKQLKKAETKLEVSSKEIAAQEQLLSRLNNVVKLKNSELDKANESLNKTQASIVEFQIQLNQISKDMIIKQQELEQTKDKINLLEKSMLEKSNRIGLVQQEIHDKENKISKLLSAIEANRGIIEQQINDIEGQNNLLIEKDQTITHQRGVVMLTLLVFAIFVGLFYLLLKNYRLRIKANRELKEVNSKLYELASTDGLTGLLNRRHFSECVQREIQRSERKELSDTFVMVDIDYFKKVNDSYGHAVGDKVIVAVADNLRKHMRKYDLIGRWGGEEYAMLLMDCDSKQAKEIAQRLCDEMADIVIFHKQQKVSLTISVGVTLLEKEDNNIETIFARADKALYLAKEKGRNCVVFV